MRVAGHVTFFWLVGGNRAVLQESWLSLKLPSSACVGALVLHKNSKILLCIFLQENQNPAPRMHYCILIDLPLFLHSLTSLIWNCLNLPFGTQWRSRGLNEAYFLQRRNGGLGKAFVPRRAPQGPAGFLFQSLKISLASQGTHASKGIHWIFHKGVKISSF